MEFTSESSSRAEEWDPLLSHSSHYYVHGNLKGFSFLLINLKTVIKLSDTITPSPQVALPPSKHGMIFHPTWSILYLYTFNYLNVIGLDPQEAKNLLQERVKLIERVDMDVDYNIEGKLPFLLSTLRSLSGLCSVVVCLLFFFLCVYLCYLGCCFWLVRTNS